MALTVITANLSSVVLNGGTSPQTYTANQTPVVGNSIIVAVGLRSIGGGATVVSSITDNQSGNTFSKIVSNFSANQSDQELWWCPALTSASGTYTLTITLTGNPGGWVIGFMEVSGGPVADQNGGNQGFGVTTLTATAGGANISPNDLVVGAIILNPSNVTTGLATPASGYTSWYLFDPNGNCSGQGAYKILAGSETSSADWTWTLAENGFATIATFSPTSLIVLPLLGTILM
jgi:hypothetical protein